MTNSFKNRRKQILEARLLELYEEYETIYAQLGRTLSDTDKVRLKRQADYTSREIKELEQELLQFEPKVATTDETAETNTEDHRVVINLTLIFIERFNDEELKTFCFNLDVDYDDLPAKGKANKARELTSYLNRHNRIKGAIAMGKQLRPDINWEDL